MLKLLYSSFAKLLIFTLACIPIKCRQILGRKLGVLAYYISKRDRNIAELQLSKILKTDNYAQVAKNTFADKGQMIFEAFNFGPLLSDEFIKNEHTAEIKDLVSKDVPVIALTAHFSNWELLARYMTEQGIDFHTIGVKIRNPFFQTFLQMFRENNGIKTIWRTNALSSNRQIVDVIRENKAVAALIDQDTRVKSVPGSFFRFPCMTPVSLIELGLKYNAKFVFILLQKIDQKYILRFHEINLKSIDNIVDEYNSLLESYIKQSPEQWVWFHKRWRRNSKKAYSHQEYLELLNNYV